MSTSGICLMLDGGALAAQQQTVRLSRKYEAEILASLESIVGEQVAGIVRALAADHG